MSTHNVGFYEEMTKIIFQLSSNIIEYAPYLFFCMYFSSLCGSFRDWSHDMDVMWLYDSCPESLHWSVMDKVPI